MKNLLLTLFGLFLIAYVSHSQSDTLIINLKNSTVEKIPITSIQKIRFENLTGINELSNLQNLNLKGNYPNPFGEYTSIEFEIAQSGPVELVIYNSQGNIIQTLYCPDCSTGKNLIEWNTRDKDNNKVLSGTYYHEVKYNNTIQTKKMIVIK